MGIIGKIRSIVQEIRNIRKEIDDIKISLGRIEGRQLGIASDRHEYKVFSQWGEDGIIQWLINNIEISVKRFIEFGVENYSESNTRYLLIHDNWSGLVMDGDENNISYIKRDEIYWRYNLKAVTAFITKENINDLIQTNYRGGKVGILSIDVDGNDYWIWKEITGISPDIVICEYNHRFGSERAVAVPYDSSFDRRKAHYSWLYYGASISAFVKLGKEKGYSLVAGNKNGNNIFFVKKELLNDVVKEVGIEECYNKGQFRESRNVEGELTFVQPEDEWEIIKGLPLVEV